MMQQKLFSFVSLAEVFVACWRETENNLISFSELQIINKQWVGEVHRNYIELTDLEVPQIEIHDWVEEVINLAGYIEDIALILSEGNCVSNVIENNKWFIRSKLSGYYSSLSKIMECNFMSTLNNETTKTKNI